MKYAQFVDRVQQQIGLSSQEEAETAVHATLQTLGERLPRSEAEKLAAQLPNEMKPMLFVRGNYPQRNFPARFLLEEFYDRVGARAGLRYHQAVQHARGVALVLSEAVSEGQIEDLLAELPDEYEELFGRKEPGPLSPSSG